ncbi:interferon tau-2-like [Pygocentrus nattereri]|uniref:interferon tau-2-like n=1 Tax=Pygocentrus nattereri TaxID=42514 RepID=UPI001890C043|nr:interferon tau-2-like [Pygocentrus nattereri]
MASNVGDDASQSAVGGPSAGSSVAQLKSYFEELEEKLRVKVTSMPTKCQLQRTLMAKTHNLLETMTGPFPLQCLDDIPVEIKSPTWALQSNNSKQDVGAAKAVYKSLMKVSSLMESDSFPQSWDADKLVKFQIIMDRQIEESECITRIKTQKEEDDFAVRDAALTDYFDKLEKLLKEKEFSVCAWEVVRREVLSVLAQLIKPQLKLIRNY